MIFDLNTLRVAALVVIAVIYACYDLFNKRDIPNIVAYASVAVGIVFTLTLGTQTMIFSILVALIVAAVSYVFYKIGQLGLGDGFEFVAISLIIPMQPVPLLLGAAQFGLPFMLSVFIATGFAAIIMVPLYCISRMKSKQRWDALSKASDNTKIKAAIMALAYGSLLLFMIYSFGFSIGALVVIAAIGIPSVMAIFYEKSIMMQMIKNVYPKELDVDDIIAVGLMSKVDIAYFKGRSKSFGKLATFEFVAKAKNLRRKLPVYKNAIPLAFPTLIGVVLALLFGNLLLLIV
ncbi:MAG: prepilin peptidase [Candidatus Micrarchaeales archaeon]